MREFAEGVWECAEFVVVEFQSLEGRELSEVKRIIERGKFGIGNIKECESV